ncbi:hypothetical protein DFP72DRAFT_1073202 [Ephemerocybe angulata]|uniref:FAD/NAD(P)-binding domain-containing protein n=1 Tax=Ephemerocybe angulata TaxID=980116 RepID=A0A8H6HP78_9AGAR|nr:hypothetical protein DFP72DRAFT_1073202 [Tulosesus angulatus]
MSTSSRGVLDQPVCIIGAGVAGLINAHVLLQDGFTNVTLLTRDASVGGVWARERVYPGLYINNVHGEYRFSCLDMPPPERSGATGGRLTGIAMRDYAEKFYETHLKGKAHFSFQTEVLGIERRRASPAGDPNEPSIWSVRVKVLLSGQVREENFARIILATGGCSNPQVPPYLSEAAASGAGYRGLVFHTSKFSTKLDEVLELVKPRENANGHENERVVVIGGGKSAQDVCAKLANEGRRVTIVFDRTDVFLATPDPIPDFARKSRFLSILHPHRVLKSRLERFLHTTWLGGKIVHAVMDLLSTTSYKAYNIPLDSPFRRAHSLFWSVRLSDDGAVRSDSFYSLVGAGAIDVVAPHRVKGYSTDGSGVTLNDGTTLSAKVVLLATGYQSSWTGIFTKETIEEIGFGKHAPTLPIEDNWQYSSMKDGPKPHPDSRQWTTTIYRGIVPAKNLLHRDFAIAGALFTANPGYTNEVVAHWISSYFQNDRMNIPRTTEKALVEAEKESVWMKIRFPDMLSWVNDSYSASLDFWTWPQAADELLEDMGVLPQRSGGGWFTWPFKIIDTKELSTLGEERRALRFEH